MQFPQRIMLLTDVFFLILSFIQELTCICHSFIANTCMQWAPVLSGVPQGTVPGPLLLSLNLRIVCSLMTVSVIVRLIAMKKHRNSKMILISWANEPGNGV